MKIHTRKNAIHSLVYDGTGIKPEPEKQQDTGTAEQIAKNINRRKKIDSNSLERWK